MKKLTIALLLVTLSALTSWAGDFQKGVSAYASGDYTTALQEFTELAEQGKASAQFNLGVMYDNGQGALQDYKQAVKWYTKAAEQGYSDAQLNLAFKYANGQGVLQDFTEARYWYTRAAEQGNTEAQFNLGFNAWVGKGVPKNYIRAHMWFNIAAASGYDSADLRDAVAENLTAQEITKAQSLARECVKKNYKGC
jgi:hypothetical protein